MLDRRARCRAVRFLSCVGVLVAALLSSRPASAYAWMIRHEYQGCLPCHTDPSGAGMLTEYGRVLGENSMRMRYGVPPSDEPSKIARFLFGVPTPEWLLLGGSVRSAVQLTKQVTELPPEGVAWGAPRFLQMEADLKAQLTFGRLRAYGSLGYMHAGKQAIELTHRDSDNLVSREHWVGVDLGEDKEILLRFGRIAVPFGIRTDEHTMLIRSRRTTRTNIDNGQQHGLAMSYSGSVLRGEIMALLGNLQLNPDALRERGYAGFLELPVGQSAAIGVSSTLTYARQDYVDDTPRTTRQLHGAFARVVPIKPLVLFVEANAMFTTTGRTAVATAGTSSGFVGMVQADVEPVQGLHLVFAGEAMVSNGLVTNPRAPQVVARSFDGWAGVLWFFAPHADLRFDFVATSTRNGPVSIHLLPQLHLYL